MNNEELKKRIRKTILDTIYNYPDDEQHYNHWLFHVADALIAAGIGDVEESENKATAAELVAQAAASTAIKKIAEWKHRAEVAERALYNMAYGEWQREGARRAICEKYAPSTARDYLDRAEKELAEEWKDD